MKKCKKMFLCMGLVIAIFITIMVPGYATKDMQTKIYMKELNKSFSVNTVILDNTVYVPVRAFITALDKDVKIEWDCDTKTASIHLAGIDVTVTEGLSYIISNNRYIYLYGTVINQNNSLILPVNPLAKALGITVEVDKKTSIINVYGEIQPLESGDTYYDADSLYWLSHIVSCESGYEPLEGQIAVANVVLNRMNNDYWPDTVYGVVFDCRGGVYQFSPVGAGVINREPKQKAIVAAKLALDGANTCGNSYFFFNPQKSTSNWISENCEFVISIGHHDFYTMDI